MNTWASFLSIALVLGGAAALQAQPATWVYPNNPEVSSAQGVPHDSAVSYFPASAAVNPNRVQPGDTSKRVSWGQRMDCMAPLVYASKNLFATQAPVLSNFFLGNAVYRFTWLRAFHQPAFFTLRCTPAGATLQVQLLNKPADQYYPPSARSDAPGISAEERARRLAGEQKMARTKRGRAQLEYVKAPVVVARNETVALTPAQVAQFLALLTQTDFWSVPSCQPQPVVDGAYWILEAHEPTRYHTVFRHSPRRGDPLRSCCEFLLDLSPLNKAVRY